MLHRLRLCRSRPRDLRLLLRRRLGRPASRTPSSPHPQPPAKPRVAIFSASGFITTGSIVLLSSVCTRTLTIRRCVHTASPIASAADPCPAPANASTTARCIAAVALVRRLRKDRGGKRNLRQPAPPSSLPRSAPGLLLAQAPPQEAGTTRTGSATFTGSATATAHSQPWQPLPEPQPGLSARNHRSSRHLRRSRNYGAGWRHRCRLPTHGNPVVPSASAHPARTARERRLFAGSLATAALNSRRSRLKEQHFAPADSLVAPERPSAPAPNSRSSAPLPPAAAASDAPASAAPAQSETAAPACTPAHRTSAASPAETASALPR